MTAMDRRRFLLSTGASAGLVALPWPRALAATALPDLVDVHGGAPAARVQAALQALGGIERFVKRGDRVVLKANAGFANPAEWGTTTHPEVVLAVARACLDAGAKSVRVVEHPTGFATKCYQRCGLEAAFKALPEVPLQLLGDGADFAELAIPGGVALQSTRVARAVLEADALINIPAAKSHGAAQVTFGLKNHMGLIQDRWSFHTLVDLHQAVADLARVIRPRLTLLDASRVLHSKGPRGPGEVREARRLVAGRDIVAVDAYGLGLGPWDGKQLGVADVAHIRLAGAAGLGQSDVARLKVQRLTI